MTFHLLSGRRPFEGQEPGGAHPQPAAPLRRRTPWRARGDERAARHLDEPDGARPAHTRGRRDRRLARDAGRIDAGARGDRRLVRGARGEPGRPRGRGDLGTDRSGGRRRGPRPRGGAAGGGGVRARNRRGPAGHTCEREGGARARAHSVPRGHERRRRDRGRFTCGRQAGHREPEASERHALQPEDRRGRGERPTDERPASDRYRKPRPLRRHAGGRGGRGDGR